MAELLIGEHCSVPTCKQLDFLPCLCNGCGRIFCKVHMCYTAHDCTRQDIAPSTVGSVTTSTVAKPLVCSCSGCNRHELIDIWCEHCKLNFCLAHRLQTDHDCASLKVIPELIVHRVPETIPGTKPKVMTSKSSPVKLSEKAKATAAKVALMKLKQTATGDKSIPDSERVYFEIILPSSSSIVRPTTAMFFNNSWSIGKVIDNVAAAKGLVNNNNVAGAKKLRLFEAVESYRIIPSDRTIASLLNQDSVVENNENIVSLYNGFKLSLEYTDEVKPKTDAVS